MNEPQTVTRPPKRPLTGWIFLLPVLLLGGALFSKRDAEDKVNRFVEPALPPPPTLAAETTPTSEPTPTFQPQPRKVSPKVTLFVPANDGKLHRRTLKGGLPMTEGLGPSLEETRAQAATRVLNLLLQQSREFFPKGTRLMQAVRDQDGVLVVSLNRQFEQSDLWQSEEETQQAVYAIVNTVAFSNPASAKSGVRLLIEGKPVESLGEMDASEPFEPNMDLVAK